MPCSETAGLGLNLDVDNRYYSGDVAAGHILSQSPVPGTVVRREWHVRVAESLGPQKVDVPDTVGQDERVAALELRRAGLEVGEIARLPFPRAAEGTVVAQDPPAHAQGIEQPSVNLLVAAPDDATPDGYVMPDFTGWPIASANAVLAKAGISIWPPGIVNVPIPPVGSGDAPLLSAGQAGRLCCRNRLPPARASTRARSCISRWRNRDLEETKHAWDSARTWKKLRSQERELRLPRLDAEVAWELGTRIRTMAAERGLVLVVDVRRFGQPLFYAALEGTTPDNPEWVRRKSNVVARFHRSSYAVGMKLKIEGDDAS